MNRQYGEPVTTRLVTFIALSYLGVFLIKLLTKAPEVGKAVANPNPWDCVCV